MDEFWDMPEIDFVDLDVQKEIDESTKLLSEKLDKPIFPASPERLLMLSLLQVILQQAALTNDVGKMNVLRYARGDFLDALASFWDEYRQEPQRSKCTLQFTISKAQRSYLTIPAGTRVKAGNNIFYTTLAAEVPPGQTTIEVVAESVETGPKQNGIKPGEITTCVDPFPYYHSVVNVTETSGGMDLEDDESFRQRVHEAPEKLSTAGPDLAYAYWAKNVDKNIGDVAVWSPNPGEVQVVPLYKDGSVPGQEALDEILNNVNARNRRPLTDKVEVRAPEIVEFDIEVDYWINKEMAYNSAEVQEIVKSGLDAFVHWQKETLGRDINPSELTKTLVEYGAKRVEVISPQFTELKRYQIAYAKNITLNYRGLEDE